MTTDAAGTQAATDNSAPEVAPLLPPTTDEDELWDASFPEDGAPEGDDGVGDEESLIDPESQDEDDEDDEDAEAQTEGDEDEGTGEGQDAAGNRTPPEQDTSRIARDAEAMFNIARDPSAIKNYPRGQRKMLRSGVAAAKALARVMDSERAPAMQQQAAAIEREIANLEELQQTDVAMFNRAVAQAHPVVVNAWYQRLRETATAEEQDADASARRSASRPQQQAQGQPEIPPEQRAIQVALSEEVAKVRSTHGDAKADELVEWVRNEGLTATPQDYTRILKRISRLSGGTATNGSRNAAVVERRKKLVKADVTPGSARIPGKIDPVVANGMSEAELWAAVE